MSKVIAKLVLAMATVALASCASVRDKMPDWMPGSGAIKVSLAGGEEEHPVVVGHDEVVGSDRDVADAGAKEAIRRTCPAAERPDLTTAVSEKRRRRAAGTNGSTEQQEL